MQLLYHCYSVEHDLCSIAFCITNVSYCAEILYVDCAVTIISAKTAISQNRVDILFAKTPVNVYVFHEIMLTVTIEI